MNSDVPIDTAQADSRFHVVGIGASAGGLEALESFFKVLPNDTGMAFVVIQHLSPDFKSHMEELLARHTSMTIHRVRNGMAVEPNSVYLIPPRMEMEISGGRLTLTEKAADRSLSHPIDQFFRSLASDVGERAVAVVLSGTGSDGSRSIRDVHDAGGLVAVQDERSAKFDGMPMNAQATGIVNLVLPPSAIAEALVRYVGSESTPESFTEQELASTALEGIDRIFQLLHGQHGLDFSHYKASTVGRRIQRRVELSKLSSLDKYVGRLNEDPEELNDLYKDLLIGVTKFFRDPEAYAVLEKQVIPALCTPDAGQSAIRVWVAGCASGEEAYSIAILIDEELRRRKLQMEVKIFATDVHHVSLHAAARGVFDEDALSELSEERRERYFRRHREGYHVSRELRRYIVFAPHNVINDAPFTQMDLVSCRNLLIYLRTAAQKKALSLFHFALRKGGTLFLGPSESPGDLSDEFDVLNKRWRLYAKRRDVRLPIEPRLPLGAVADTLPRAVSSSRLRKPPVDSTLISIYDRLLDRKMPPSILVDDDYEILHIFGGAQRYIKSRGGRPNNNLLAVVDEPLKSPLVGALQQAKRKDEVVHYAGIQWTDVDGCQTLKIAVEPLDGISNESKSLLIELEPMGPMGGGNGERTSELPGQDAGDLTRGRVASLESELQFSQQNLQSTIEEMETSNEELQATNEELVASNEELQSTNEELHSVNEELYTVNAEHQRRVEELAEANADMDNLLATTRVGVIFLDEDLRIRRYTPEIARMFQLVPHDIGRSIEGFAHHLNRDSLAQDLRRVIDEQLEMEFEVEDRTGTAHLLRVLPYRTGEQVQGVVITLVDIQTLKAAQRELERYKFMTESAVDPIMLIDREGRLVYANPAMSRTLGYDRERMVEMTVSDFDTVHDRQRFRDVFDEANRGELEEFASEWKCADGTILPIELSVNGVELGGQRYFCAFARDVTDRRAAEMEMRLQHLAIESTLNGIVISDATTPDNPITYSNPGFSDLTGYPKEEILGRNCRFLQGSGTDDQAVNSLRDSIRRGEPVRVTLRNYRKDGTPFWNDLQVTPVRDEHGRLVNYVGVQHDITEQIDAETAATNNSERIAAILDTAAEGIYGIDKQGRCTFCNRSALKLLGYADEEEVYGKEIHTLIHHSKADHSPLPVQDCPIYRAWQKNETVHASDEVFWRKDGSSFPVEYWSRPFVRGGKVRGAVVSFQDISERLALSNRLERMGRMIDGSYDAIIAWELNGKILSWNYGATQLYGYTAEDAIGSVTHELLSTVHPRPWAEIHASLLESGEWVGVLEHTTQAGARITVSSRQQLLRFADGREQVLEINRDITEQTRIQNELERANAAAKQASQAKSAFLANISHELRTPMTAVLGFADILRMESDRPEHLDRVDTIKRNGEYLLALLNDLLDLSKIEAGKLSIEREAIHTGGLLRDVQSLMDVRASEKGIPLIFEWKSRVPRNLTADHVRLRQILVNLIGNAIKFTDEGEVRVVTQIKHRDGNASLDIAVHDTGIGMTLQQQSELFTPFSQPTQNNERRFGGTGLGLSISKRLAEAMGGSISVESEPGVGSCFVLSLPLLREQLDDLVSGDDEVIEDTELRQSSGDLPRIEARILLADDRRDVWRIGKYFLEKCGARVTVVEDGQQAVDAMKQAELEEDPFGLVLMDMNMPIMTGREAVAELRRRGFRQPIIALTADAMAGERDACIEIGCDEYFPKPIHGVKLMNLVADLLKSHAHRSK